MITNSIRLLSVFVAEQTESYLVVHYKDMYYLWL